MRRGDWKLIRFYARNEVRPDDFELYDLKNDVGKRANLAKEPPEIVCELGSQLAASLEDTGAVIPKLNPNYSKAAPSGLRM